MTIGSMLSIKPAAEDLAARQPVWEALSDMFLDMDTSLSRQWRADQLARSPYSIEQLEFILVNEVYPICKYNLLSMAGEWAGFDPEWLKEKILCHLGSRFRFWHTLNLGCFTVHASVEWRTTKYAILAARDTDAKSTT
ncbi:hypothetical protein [Nitrosomonas sp.]|uniref:DUF7079 family protein n=2 Tax=Nitrosomonas sp. TaxID=42353 RepID=UPI003306770D